MEIIKRYLKIRDYLEDGAKEKGDNLAHLLGTEFGDVGHEWELYCLLDEHNVLERFVNKLDRPLGRLRTYSPVEFEDVKRFFLPFY